MMQLQYRQKENHHGIPNNRQSF